MKFIVTLGILGSLAAPVWAQQGSSVLASRVIDLPALNQELQTTGLSGWVHGAAPEFNQYVFTWRDPNDFFLHFEFPMITANPKLKAELAKLGRHDEILITGKFADLEAPIRHIRVSSLQVKQKFVSAAVTPHYVRQAKLPDDLVGKTSLVGKVHAVVEGGSILVIEYKDAVIPVFVKDNSLTRDLYRNDIIRLHYLLRQHPGAPSHVEPDPAVSVAIEVLEHLVDLHGQPAGGVDPKTGQPLGLEGVLVMFPKSPQVVFNVFALQVTDKYGVKREHTLVNFDDADVFLAIRSSLQEMWDKELATVTNGRNKLINTKIRLRAFGTGNVVDPGQANPQIKLKDETAIVRVP